MKITIKSLLILGLISNFYSVFSMDGAELSKNINDRSKESYKQFQASEQRKRKLRYCACGLGIVGIGGLIYYSWKSSDIRQQQARLILNRALAGQNITPQERADLDSVFHQGHDDTVTALTNQLSVYQTAASAVSWKQYAFNSIKNSFFNLQTLGTAMAVMALQGFGAGFIIKGVLNPLAEKFLGIYSINRFIATKTKLNQNIKDLIRSLSALNKQEIEDVKLDTYQFDLALTLLEKDVVDILGFMLYICSMIPDEPLIKSKARMVFAQTRKCLIDLHELRHQRDEQVMKDAGREIEQYKDVLGKLVGQCESFSDICAVVGTDFLEDFSALIFDQLKQSINVDIAIPQLPMGGDMDAFKQMLSEIAEGNLGEGL